MSRAFDVTATPLERGTFLLEASAGTGKTWSLTSVAVRLVLEGVEEVERILLVTFTRKATDELRQRLRERLYETELVLRGRLDPERLAKDHFLQYVDREWKADPEARKRIADARRDVDLARVRTIHQFCLEVLAEGAFEAGFPLDGARPGQTDVLLETAWKDTLRDFALGHSPMVAEALGVLKLTGIGLGRIREALRESSHAWLPAERDFAEVEATYLEAIGAVDISALVSFADGVPEDGWIKPGHEEVLPWIELVRGGLDLDRAEHRRAVLGLSRDFFEKGLSKKKQFKPLLPESGLLPMLDVYDEAREAFAIGLEQSLLRHTVDRYRALKDRHGVIDHDDVIAQTRARLLDGDAGDRLARRIGDRFEAALIDEFQDTDRDQWDVFRKIFTAPSGEDARHVLVLVGDPKQAIYRFRGADIYAYLQARDAADTRATLAKNWRSAPGLVAAVNSVFGRTPTESFALEEIEFEPVEAARGETGDDACPMQVVWVDLPDKANEDTVQALVLQRFVQDVLARRAEVPTGEGRKLAMLVPTHRHARAAMRALREVDLDAVLARGGDIHDSDAMREWRVILRALLDPSNLGLQRRARATRLWGTALSGLGPEAAGHEDVELLARLRRAWVDEGVATMGAMLVRERRAMQRCLAEEGGERMVTDLRHGLELLNREEASRGLGPEALLRWAEAEARSDDPENEERPLRLDRESDAIQILTNFTSKGLEFDTVFLPFAWHRRGAKESPPLRAHDDDGRPVFDFRSGSPWRDQALLEDVASDLRMHYVELTRAKERCVLYLAAAKTWFHRTPAAFLLARDDQPAGENRGAWVRAVRGGLQSDIDSARETIEKRLADEPTVQFRTGATAPEAGEVNGRREVLAPRPLSFPRSRHGALVPWRQLSYTALVHALHERADLPSAEQPLADRADPADAATTASPSGIFGFARGARAGICLHELLEKSAFDRPVDGDDRHRVEALLARHLLDSASAHPGEIDPVQVSLDLVERVRAESLPFGGGTFSGLDADKRLDEWQFNLPVVDLVPADLAGLVAEHWTGEEWIDRAADRLARLSPAKVQGMLGGFVDLLFTDGERWTVLDWKSNDLGATTNHYSQDAMRRAMVEHDYVIQLLFYLVAAHRFLRTRLVDYDYDRHVAGASYVFLRGLCGRPDTGWCNVTPPRSLIEAIDGLFAGGGR